MEIQLGFFEAILDFLRLRPLFFAGMILIGIALYWSFQKDSTVPKVRTVLASFLLYYLLGILFRHIVGIPTLSGLFRITGLGESIFNPNIHPIPFADGITRAFILNIFAFIPIGFLCPFVSKSYQKIKEAALFGLGISLTIEISQLFTLHRLTDINDLLTNTLGTVIGCLCFGLFAMIFRKNGKDSIASKTDVTRFLPVCIAATAFIFTFLL